MSADSDSRYTSSTAESGGTPTVNTHGSPRAVGGWTPEEWADRIRQDIDHCQDDLPGHVICIHEGDLILRRVKSDPYDMSVYEDYIVLW